MAKKKIRTMGNFEPRVVRNVKPKFCKNCGRPVRETVGNLGYCKKCIEQERQKGRQHGQDNSL